MSDSWFDTVDQPPAPEHSRAPREQEAPDNDGKKKNRSIIPLVLGLIVIVAVALALLINSANSNDQEAASQASSTPQTQAPMSDEVVPADPDSLVGVAGDCKPETGGVMVTAGEETIRGAVAQWQAAYYSQDVETLTSAIAEGSWLRENEWPDILAEAAPEGTTYCAVMSPLSSPEIVDVDVTVIFPDGTSQTYPQRVTGVLEGDSWKISTIDPREE